MPIIQKNTVRIGDDIFADIEVHPKTDVPCFYPRFTTSFGSDVLFLCDLHDKDYQPSPREKEKLVQQIQTKKSWAYLRPLANRTRES